jgi:hypothetical protein
LKFSVSWPNLTAEDKKQYKKTNARFKMPGVFFKVS